MAKEVLGNAEMDLAFVWNRTVDKIEKGIPSEAIIDDLEKIGSRFCKLFFDERVLRILFLRCMKILK